MKARGLFKKLMVLLCAFAVLSVGADFKGLAVSSEGDGSSNSEEVSSQQEPDAPVLLEEMYAFVLTPGVDFYKDPTASAETVSKELDQLLDKVVDLGFNAVILKTSLNG